MKEVILREHLEKGRPYRSLSEEYGYSLGVLSGWVKKYRKECQENQYLQENRKVMEENRRLREELAESRKEVEFLKKSGGILCEGKQIDKYRFIDLHGGEFGVVWLLRNMRVYPNAYYNYKKRRKAVYLARRDKIQARIQALYHEWNGIPGYRMMRDLLKKEGVLLSGSRFMST